MARNENIYTSGQYLANNPGWNAEDAHWKAAIIAGLMKDETASSFAAAPGCGAYSLFYRGNGFMVVAG